ncbi:MAG: DUF938 domain-containing protein [Acaryochloridaceae cyanobacterium SU_2_1]|nr:DUF938 domain-containing protein [Acaryochloridaceae cyanobacterium SU_2_1]NJM95378.1 DUF938 domain-containing protein [Acaryochloridaceae cyanobacterium CSU_5_19]
MPQSDLRQSASAVQRNRQPILEVLQRFLLEPGWVVEIASGTGEHGVYMAQHLPHCFWLPSDRDNRQLASIRAWQGHAGLSNLYPPLPLDAQQAEWPIDFAQAIAATEFSRLPVLAVVSINMIHISPWAATLGLMAGAAQLLPAGGLLYLYGPFKQQGIHTAPSNAAFDDFLHCQNSEWGVRDLDQVVDIASGQGLSLHQVIEMPSNNLSVILRNGG